MDSPLAALLLLLLTLLAVWAAVCLIGMAVLSLPLLLYYAAYGLCVAVAYLAVIALSLADWLQIQVRSIVMVALGRRQQAAALRRERKRTITRQQEAQAKIAAIFATADRDMERLNVR